MISLLQAFRAGAQHGKGWAKKGERGLMRAVFPRSPSLILFARAIFRAVFQLTEHAGEAKI